MAFSLPKLPATLSMRQRAAVVLTCLVLEAILMEWMNAHRGKFWRPDGVVSTGDRAIPFANRLGLERHTMGPVQHRVSDEPAHSGVAPS